MEKVLNDILKDKNKYQKLGYDITYQAEILIINYCQKRYEVKIVLEDGIYYWVLTPYNKAYFKTKINNFEMVLFAIKENEQLYSN